MKTIHGAFFFASLNKSLTLDAPTPTNISTKSEPLIIKNGTPASPATAFAKSVLPVPGCPTSRTPFGILAPISVNFFGDFRNSTISCNSSFSSSTPATSLKVTFPFSVVPTTLALLLPNAIVLFPPPCAVFVNKSQKITHTISIAKGDNSPNIVTIIDCDFSSKVNLWLAKSSLISAMKASILGIFTSFSILSFLTFT